MRLSHTIKDTRTPAQAVGDEDRQTYMPYGSAIKRSYADSKDKLFPTDAMMHRSLEEKEVHVETV